MSSRLSWSTLTAVMLGACSVGSRNTYPLTAPVRALSDLPATLIPADSVAPGQVPPTAGCRGRLTDPRDGSVLVLRSSQAGEVGDYEPPPGGYGLRPDEYLRVDCRTLRPLGAIPKPR